MTMHRSVLIQEAIEGLAIQADGIYIDATFGRGGHSGLILQHLSPLGKLLAIDKDPEAIAYGNTLFGEDARFQSHQESFADLAAIAKKTQIYGKVNGILLDLGVSSPQLDTAARGFSFMQDGPLDMRMDNTQLYTAAQFIQDASVEEMADIFKEYGEERFAKRIAKAIAQARSVTPIQTTAALAAIVKAAHPKWEKQKHPATRVFQAIRMHVNQELTDLTRCLCSAMECLAVNGRLVVISFHSLEDRLVKRFMREKEEGMRLPSSLPVVHKALATNFRRVGKAIKPSIEEKNQNHRARSAILRIGEKTA